MEVFELDVWKGDWGLPSVDTECLQVLVYAKINNIPLKINASNNPFKTPNGRLPVLRCKDGTFDTVKDIIGYFRGKHYNTECGLTEKQCAKVLAYDAMFREKLFPALQFIWWIDNKNVDDLIRPWYSKALCFPLNFYYPGKFERQARTLFETLYPSEDNMTVIENQVYAEAQKCLTLLSTMIGESEYVFKQGPTVLDAIIYSYLALLLQAPLPNAALKNHLKACTNLVNYVEHISDRYFKNEYPPMIDENAQKLKKDPDNEFPNKVRDQLLVGLAATFAMAGYALSTGLVKVTSKGVEFRMKPQLQF